MNTQPPRSAHFPPPDPLSMEAAALAQDARRYFGHQWTGDAGRSDPLDA